MCGRPRWFKRLGSGRRWFGSDHVSGLCGAARGRWPRWVPRTAAKQRHGLHQSAVGIRGLLRSSVRPTSSPALASFSPRDTAPWAQPAPPAAPGRPPRAAGIAHTTRAILLCQSHRHQLARPTLQQSQQPSRCVPAAGFDMTDHRHGSHHQQLSQALIAGPADAAKPRLAATRPAAAPRHYRPTQAAKCRPERNCDASTIGLNVIAPNGPIPGTWHSRHAAASAFHRLPHLRIQGRNLLIQMRHLIGEHAQHPLRPLPALPPRLTAPPRHQPCHLRRALRRNNTKFRGMPAPAQ